MWLCKLHKTDFVFASNTFWNTKLNIQRPTTIVTQKEEGKRERKDINTLVSFSHF